MFVSRLSHFYNENGKLPNRAADMAKQMQVHALRNTLVLAGQWCTL